MQKKMNEWLSLATVAVALVAIGTAVGYEAFSQDAPARRVKPFIAEQRILHTTATQSTPIIQRSSHIRRSDGSYIRKYEVESPAGEKGWMVEIHDVRNKRSITLEPFTKSAMTFYYSEADMRKWSIRGQENCSSPEVSAMLESEAAPARDSMRGKEVLRVLNGSEDRKGPERMEAWVAPDLDCFVMQKSITRPSGAMQQVEVTELAEGEPPDSMFEIPSDYIEASPAQVEAAYQAKYPGHTYLGKMAETINERYVAGRADN